VEDLDRRMVWAYLGAPLERCDELEREERIVQES
jgi:hypothetical protein